MLLHLPAADPRQKEEREKAASNSLALPPAPTPACETWFGTFWLVQETVLDSAPEPAPVLTWPKSTEPSHVEKALPALREIAITNMSSICCHSLKSLQQEADVSLALSLPGQRATTLTCRLR